MAPYVVYETSKSFEFLGSYVNCKYIYVRDFHNYGKRFPELILKICLKKHNSSNLEFQGFDSFCESLLFTNCNILDSLKIPSVINVWGKRDYDVIYVLMTLIA